MNSRVFLAVAVFIVLASRFTPLSAASESVSDRPHEWSGGDLRRVHTVFSSPPWAENRGLNFDPRRYVRDLKAAGAGTIEFYLKDHFGNAYFKTAVGNYFGTDLLTPLVEESHAQGMKFVAYYSMGLDNWAYVHHPEWRRSDDGSIPKLPGFPFLTVDVQSKYFDYMIQHLKDIAVAPVDGWFLDVCCDGKFGNASLESLRSVYETIKKRHPNSLITWNGAGTGEADVAFDQYTDFSSNEGWRYDKQSAIARFMRRLNKPFTVESPGGYVGLGWGVWTLKPPLMLQLEGAVVSSNGGALAVGLNPYADGTVKPAEISRLSMVWNFIQKREGYFIKTRSAAEIGLLLSTSGSELPGLHEALMDYQIDYAVTTELADFDNYSLLILTDQVKLSAKTVERVRRFVENGGKLLAFGRSFARLEDVLGVRVQGDSEIPYSASFAALKAPQLQRSIPDYPILIRGGAVRARAEGGSSLAKVINPVAEYTPRTAFGWGYNPPGEETRDDLVVVHRYGKGETIYVAAPLDEDLAKSAAEQNGAIWLKQLLFNMVDLLLPNRLVVAEAPPGIELVTNWQNDRLIVNLINYHAMLPNHYVLDEKRIIKASGIILRVNEARFGKPARVVMEPENRELRWARAKGWLEIKVPDFLIHSLVVLEPEKGLTSSARSAPSTH